ncbi:MAG TPA: hypothetical protein VLH19_04690 [Patescibacteria group bacterium]|nr:hypothetical protein [Patescibacteria group bacterium]
MAEQQPTVVIIEDDVTWSKMLPEFVEPYPVIVLRTLSEALDFINTQSQAIEEQRVNVVAFIVDGNLTEDARGGAEGEMLIEIIRKKSAFDSANIISNSGGNKLAGADFHAKKKEEGLAKLPEWIGAKRV